jgi:short-subunit dehydrogenase
MIKNITVIGASAGIGFETVKRALASNQPTVVWLAE